jgi:hypothetical protein
MADLITRARAIKNLDDRETTADEDDTLDNLVSAVSQAVENYCGREFDAQQFDELYRGQRKARLLLDHYPIISVERVAYGPNTVLSITNTSAANQRATVKVTATGLTLTRVASGVVSTDTSVTWAGNVTLAAVATAVNALGNGWSATVADTAYSNRASADLRAIQGALNAKDMPAELQMHLFEVGDFQVLAEEGALVRCSWHGGAGYWRIIYTAGYASVPEDVQEACAQWVATLFWQTKRDPGLASETIPGAIARAPLDHMPASVRTLLLPYRSY